MFGHHRGRFIVDQIAMFDRAHAAPHRAADRARRVGMRHHIGAGIARLFDRRADLVLAVAEEMNRVVGRGDAARGHDLDLRGALLDFLANGLADRIDAVDDARDRADLGRAGAGLDDVVALAHVAMAAGLRQRASGRKDARPGDHPGAGGLGERPVRAARIAHRREPAIEHAAQDRHRTQHREHIRDAGHPTEIEHRGHAMHMTVDQSGHQRLPMQVMPYSMGTRTGQNLGITAHGQNAALRDRNGLRLGSHRIHSENISVEPDRIGVHGRSLLTCSWRAKPAASLAATKAMPR